MRRHLSKVHAAAIPAIMLMVQHTSPQAPGLQERYVSWPLVMQAMEKQDDARRFIWAAEYKASEFFRRMKDSKEQISSGPRLGNAADADARRMYISVSTAAAAKNLEDMRAAAQQVCCRDSRPIVCQAANWPQQCTKAGNLC